VAENGSFRAHPLERRSVLGDEHDIKLIGYQPGTAPQTDAKLYG
jgi:hypothetical protein